MSLCVEFDNTWRPRTVRWQAGKVDRMMFDRPEIERA
jgi:hypothetical protein